MILTGRMKLQLLVFFSIALVAGSVMIFGYIKAPTLIFGVGRYTVTVELPRAGGLYSAGNVTYRGTEVGRIKSVDLVNGRVQAVLSLDSDIPIPSDLDAEVHSQSAIGEQYVALLPRNGTSRPLQDGDVIPVDRTTVPPDINGLLDATNRGLQAIPQGDLNTVIEESYAAFGGMGPDIARLVKGTTALAMDSRANLESIMSAIDNTAPVLDSQTQTAGSIKAWASHLATITGSLQAHDAGVAGILTTGPAAADEARALIDRLKPTLPVLLANLVSIGNVGVAYSPAIEQLLVLLPQGIASMSGSAVMLKDVKTPYNGTLLNFNLNLNAPPTCSTGFLPPQQIRPPSFEDAPDAPAGDRYCRIPQESRFTAVRGARNYPCLTRPGKRAPTVEMCESDEQYVPLNDGHNWKGDPNATLSGQDVPQVSRAAAPAAAVAEPAIATALYDPATGSYVGSDGKSYTQSDLAQNAPQDKTWQTMLTPSPGS